MIYSKPRVGYVLKAYPRFSETFILGEILAHQRAGLDLEIFSLRPSTESCFHESLAEVRSPVTYISRGSSRSASFWKTLNEAAAEFPQLWACLDSHSDQQAEDVEQAIVLARHIRDRELTHLHAHFGSVATAVARLAAKLSGITYSFTAHAKDIFHESVDRQALGERIADASQVITVSQFNLRFLSDEYPASADKINLVYNGLNLGAFLFNDSQDRSPLILGVGRLVEKKGFDDLIAACRILKDQGADFVCEIIGSGRLQVELSELIDGLDVGDRVTLVGPLPQQQLRQRLSEASLMAAPCVVAPDADRDGLPTVLLEAMALGVPCISTDVTGIPEVLKHRQTGLAVRQRDAAGLASACDQLLNEPGLRAQLALAARALITERFDIERNTQQLRSCLGLETHANPPVYSNIGGAAHGLSHSQY